MARAAKSTAVRPKPLNKVKPFAYRKLGVVSVLNNAIIKEPSFAPPITELLARVEKPGRWFFVV